ncbi:MAG TPA: FtsW/RodA/SpoVE family cell cycle protein, partial [Chloroflexota bacterium]|nr:FtsW/RodA/SpoVE family cell cycle protein [Chloroflexota bacterium]
RPGAAARFLLLFPALLLAVGVVQLALVRKQAVEWQTLTGAALFALALLIAAIWQHVRLPRADPLLLPLAAGLAAIGQLMTSRLEPGLGPRQGIWVLIGLGALMLVGFLPSIEYLKRYRYTWAVLALALQVFTLLFGQDPNGSGAALWFTVGPVSVQPTEGVKLLLVLFLASYLDDYRELLGLAGKRIGPLYVPPLPYLAPILVMIGAALILFWRQKDLGPALLFSTVLFTMLYVASGRVSYVVLGIVLLVLGGALASQLFEHVHTRVLIWLDPWSNRQTLGYQLVQALYALSSGGALGVGLDEGSPLFIPAVHTDFVIAAIGEELGLAGALAVIGLFVLLVVRGFLIAMSARGGFAMLLAAGLTSVIGLQALIILAGALQLIPLTGITLPLVSYGGSSVVANFLIVGVLLRISNDAR